MPKQIIYAHGAREELLRGIDIRANAVAITLGPKGRNVAIDRGFGEPGVSHDGVTVAKDIALPDSFQNMGAQLLKEAASQTNDLAGDGTTTSIVLAQAIVHEGMKNLAAGANAMMLKKGILAAVQAVSEHLIEQAIPVEAHEAIAQVATVSAQDAEIGERIADVMDKVGKDGIITVETGNTMDLEVEYVAGMQFDRGFISRYFAMNEAMEAVLTDPHILIYDGIIRSADEMVLILEMMLKASKRELVIIAQDVMESALATLILNTLNGNMTLLAVKAPGFGDRRKSMLRDIAILTGGTVISQETGRTIETTSIKDLGHAGKVTATTEHTTLIDGAGEANIINDYISSIRAEIEMSTSDYEREKLEERVASLSGGVAVLKVGAATETELKEKKSRIEDALNATRAAAEAGIVPGGGVALMNTSVALLNLTFEDADINTGVNVVRHALEVPMRRLIENEGLEGAVIVNNVRRLQKSEKNPRIGYNVMTDDYGDMIVSGIPDPAKVTRTALESAASIVAMILSVEALVANKSTSVA